MDTVQEVLERAWKAHSEGAFDSALADYIWLFDASAADADSASLRLSYILSAWAKLAEEHLPARHALVELRDRDSRRLLAQAGDANAAVLFNDIRAINDKLGDLQNTWHLFQQLPEALAAQCARSALPSLMVCGDYALARRHFPHPEQHLAQAAALLNERRAGLNVLTTAGMSALLAEVYNYVTELALVLDLLAGCGDTAAAEAARAQAVTLVQSPEARACVQAELDAPGTTLDAMIELENSSATE
ncbi:hypothetical protein D0T25_25345 [Duganella sp. BJB488]|uniref:hypothetical protein n=1 Tax=unclassified Duganella TaxID=2636909 RepID=UPI000E346747|nr:MULTISPECIES: hypothetical protein [unclassified Duganella]NVD74012.1 hypothetical protein [Duganella sp. BJB1802]RFP12319.1 hypothetical protein D0T26_23810 [Duganella sp. BJB489]RFP16587.1 hypothetical protein D0T25_25345 [Duganella sp. BJB488]RFP30683.1 hypothetical protein D0T24_25155 [Duganella sp. BJB480]